MTKISKNTFGIYIDNTSITAVELGFYKNENKPRVINYGRIELEPGIVEDSSIFLNSELFKKNILELLKNGKYGRFLNKNVHIAIPEGKTFFHTLNVPTKNTETIKGIIKSAKDFIPINLSEAIIDYKIKSTNKDGFSIVDFTAVQKNVVLPIIKILEEVGLNVIGVETCRDSIIRSCNNYFQKNNDFMVINIGEQKTLLAIKIESDGSYAVCSNTAGGKIIETVKDNLNISSRIAAKELLIHPDDSKTDKYNNTAKGINNHIQHFIDKTKKLLNIIKNKNNNIKIKTIYFTGIYSRTPGVKEAFSNMLSDVEVIDKFKYIDLKDNTELYYSEAIGLALRNMGTKDEVQMNLIPGEKKKELDYAKLMPIIRKWLIVSVIIIGGFMVFMGIVTEKRYFSFKMSEQNLARYEEKVNNPYLQQAVQNAQQKTQLNSQVNTILKEAIPPSYIMKEINNFNSEGIQLSSVHYQINNKREIIIQIGARGKSRQDTENFILLLENNRYFSEIISPLANLVGKGDRFIGINFKVDPLSIITDFNKSKENIIKRPVIKN